MPAKIVVTSGPIAGREFPIRKAAVRVGRSLNCEIPLDDPALPEHALTVQFDGTGYTVFNKTNSQMVHQGKALPGHHSVHWDFGEEIGIGGSSKLRLEIMRDSFDAKPTAAMDWSGPAVIDDSPVESDIFEEVSREAAPSQPDVAGPVKKESSSQTAPLVIILCCVLAAGVILAKKFMPTSESTAVVKKPVTLEELIPKLKERIAKSTKNHRNTEPEAERIYVLLLETRTSDADTAKANYRKIMDYLRPHMTIAQVDDGKDANKKDANESKSTDKSNDKSTGKGDEKSTGKGGEKSTAKDVGKSTDKSDKKKTDEKSTDKSDPKSADEKSTEKSETKSAGDTSSSQLIFTDDLYREVFEYVSPKL